MNFPEISGVIRRRILVNFRVKPEVIRRILPEPFQPKLIHDWTMAGICLIRLEEIRPSWLPAPIGIWSENAAHRVAVVWSDAEGDHEGVYIPQRHTGSLLNQIAGGRLFPGEHGKANFSVTDDGTNVSLSMRASEGAADGVSVDLRAHAADALPSTSVFKSLDEASDFFRGGCVGYSETACGTHLDGVVLQTQQWQVAPLAVEHVQSSFFSDTEKFPPGSAEFDCALIMRNIKHKWLAVPEMNKKELSSVR